MLPALASSDPPTSASKWLSLQAHTTTLGQFLKKVVETQSPYVAKACIELLAPRDPPTSASQSVGIPGVSHCVGPGQGSLTPFQDGKVMAEWEDTS